MIIMTARLFIAYLFLRSVGVADGYGILPTNDLLRLSFHSVTGNLKLALDGGNEISQAIELQSGDDPCWQNMLDDDCSMGNIYAANFVASKWIQSMPCGEGIEDCDMPAALSSPDARPEAGVDQVDVMKFLGLQRVESLSKKMP